MQAMSPEARAAISAAWSPAHEPGQPHSWDHQEEPEPVASLTSKTDQKALYKQIRKQVVAEERARHEADLVSLEAELSRLMHDKATYEKALSDQRDEYEVELAELKQELARGKGHRGLPQ
jgi:hypothetical protein